MFDPHQTLLIHPMCRVYLVCIRAGPGPGHCLCAQAQTHRLARITTETPRKIYLVAYQNQLQYI